MIVEIEWFPAWTDALAEDEKLQGKAADRLVEYLRNGELYLNGKRLRLLEAETIHLSRSNNDGPLGVRYSVEVDVRVA